MLKYERTISMSYKHSFPLTVFLLLVLLLALLGEWVSFPPAALAGPALPPRLTPNPAPEGGKDHKKDKPAGAFIELDFSSAPADAWAVVQWHCPSDGRSAGSWREVEGWRGSLPGSGRWWVHPKDFGTGPFRWLVTAGPGGSVLGSSRPFQLPGAANQVNRVTLAPGAP
jgi:hypothetical protein